MQTKYELTLNYGAKWANAWFTGEIVSILDKSSGVKSTLKRPLRFRAKRSDKYGFTTWIVSLHDSTWPTDDTMWKTGYTPHIDYMNEPVGETPSLKETQDMYQAVLAAFTTFAQHGFHRLGRRCTRKLRYNDPEILIGDKLSASIPEALASDLELTLSPAGDCTELDRVYSYFVRLQELIQREKSKPVRQRIRKRGLFIYREGLYLRVREAREIEYSSAENSVQLLQYEHIMSRPILALGCPDVTSSILAYQKEGYSREAISFITGAGLEEVKRVLTGSEETI